MVTNSLGWPIERLKEPDLHGELTVNGQASVHILCPERPLLAFVWFCDEDPPKVGCGPIRVDDLTIEVIKLGAWFLNISWNIRSGNSRMISWEVTLAKGWWRIFLEWIGWF